MSKINEITLTPEMQAVLLHWLGRLPDAEIAGAGEMLPGGFRKPSLIRERLKGIIEGPGTIPPWMLGQVMLDFRICGAVSALSVAALRANFDLLTVVVDPPDLLIALAADERPEVRRLAADHLSIAGKVFPYPEREAAGDVWMDFVGVNLMELAGRKVTTVPNDPGALTVSFAEVERVEQQLAEQEQASAELKTKLDKERAARAADRQQLTASARAEQDRLAREISQLKQQLHALADQKAALERKLQDVERGRAEAIRSGVKAELATLDRQWLAEALDLEAVVAETSPADLLLRVQSVLEAQKAQDRVSGNRLELGRRLQELRAARQQLQDTRENAIHPVRELAALTEEVEAEIARLQNKLGLPRPDNEFFERLLQQIHGAREVDGLREAGRLVDSLCEVRLLAAGQTRQAYAALQRRHDILLAQSKRSGHESPDHWLSFPSLLHHNLDCLLLLDGHNVLFALDHLQPCFENGNPGAKARGRLIELVQRLIAGRAKVHARIVFDGPVGSVQTVGANLEVEFSGGTADQRADDAIVRHLGQKSFQELKRRTFVVTNDHHLQQRIRTQNAYYMPAGAFDLMLQKFNCL
jgi:predicted RNA-binding protein with PIN domain